MGLRYCEITQIKTERLLREAESRQEPALSGDNQPTQQKNPQKPQRSWRMKGVFVVAQQDPESLYTQT